MTAPLYSEAPSACYEVDGELAYFIRACSCCGRFVKAGETVRINHAGQVVKEPNATCSRCGPVEMEFEGYYPLEAA